MGHFRAQANAKGRLRALPNGGRLRGPSKLGSLVAPGPLGRALGWRFCAGTIRGPRSPEKYVDVQRAIGGLVDELPEEGFTHRLVDSYWAKG
jgi:hypothetical protein